MFKYIMIVILSIIFGCLGYILVQSYLKKRKYRAKYDTIMTHLYGMDFPRMQLCNIYACEDEMIFVVAEQEIRIQRDNIQRVGLYSEHDFRRKAELDGVQIGSLEGLVRAIPRKNQNKDIYVLVVNYLDRRGEIAIAGFVNDVLVQAIEIFVKSINDYYGLITEVIEIGEKSPEEVDEPADEAVELQDQVTDSVEEIADKDQQDEQTKHQEL